MATASGREARGKASRKPRRSSSWRSDSACRTHYGPVASTSSAALVQAYLTFDAPRCDSSADRRQLASKSSSSPTSISNESGSRASNSGGWTLHMSESRFDLAKRRFGGKSKPVCSIRLEGSTVARGERLHFGPTAEIVATNEAVHKALRCRCVFILLRESRTGTQDRGGCGDGITAGGGAADMAHLIALSPDDLFSALRVDAFPLTPSAPPAAKNADEDRIARARAAGFLPRAFDVVDGPIVVYRPAARAGEPWTGLEVYRPRTSENKTRSWAGQRLTALAAEGQTPGDQAQAHEASYGGCDISGRAGKGRRSSFRLDLSSVGDGGASRYLEIGADKSTQHEGLGPTTFLVCAPLPSLPPPEERLIFPRTGHSAVRQPSDRGGCDTCGAVIALPAITVSTVTADDTPSTWASLSLEERGEVSVAPWRVIRPSLRRFLTCLCRAPSMDSSVGDRQGALGRIDVGRGMALRPQPPSFYVGLATDIASAQLVTPAAVHEAGSGSLLELDDRGTLSRSRSLPVPPRAVATAAIDDAKGALVVSLADDADTVLVLARGGSDLPTVEEHTGVSAAYVGDFVGNGREQVALLPTRDMIGGDGGSKGGARHSSGAAVFEGCDWEQQPLKALVKRAIVTDCSQVWGQTQRNSVRPVPLRDEASADVVGAKRAAGSRSAAGPDEPESSSRRKRPRTHVDTDDPAKGEAVDASTSVTAPVEGASPEREGDDRIGRLSSVVKVLRRRVRSEEARLLQLRQTRREKAALLEAAMLALVARVGPEASAAAAEGSPCAGEDEYVSAAKLFCDGQRDFADSSSTLPPWMEQSSSATLPAPRLRPPLQCKLARVRIHAPSRTLCLDARIVAHQSQSTQEASSLAVIHDVSLSIACAGGCLTTRSAVCPRLLPGESATVRACTTLPLGVLTGKSTPFFVSSTWCLRDGSAENGAGSSGAGGGGRDSGPIPRSAIFARVLVSPQDMLGVGALASTADGSLWSQPARAEGELCAQPHRGSSISSADQKDEGWVGLFDVGTRLDLLVHSDTTSLAALPQAVRSLSAVASLPEPWAGGASAVISACSDRAAECTLRAGDTPGAAAVLLEVAAAALPDGAGACADHASERGCRLMTSAVSAFKEEMEALEAVARAHRGSGRGGAGAAAELSEALDAYAAAQMKSDALAADLTGRLIGAVGSRGI